MSPDFIGSLLAVRPRLLELDYEGNYQADVKILERASALSTILQQANASLEQLVTGNTSADARHKLSDSDMATVKSLSNQLSTAYRAQEAPPNVSPTQITDMKQSVTHIRDWTHSLSGSKHANTMGLIKKMVEWAAKLQIPDTAGSSFRNILIRLGDALTVNVAITPSELHHSMCLAVKGVGGCPGAPSIDSNRDVRNEGGDGQDGTVLAKFLGVDSRASDLEVPKAFALPDHCRMVLQKPDDLFFSGTVEDARKAKDLYEKLLKRLSFVERLYLVDLEIKTDAHAFMNQSTQQQLVRTQTHSQNQSHASNAASETTPLANSYALIEDIQRLSLNIRGELQDIVRACRTRRDRMLVGQDMFSYSPNFAPRLNYFFYQKRIEQLKQDVMDFEAFTAAYGKELENEDQAAGVLRDKIANFDKQERMAKARREVLLADDGRIKAMAIKIEAATPILKDKLVEILDKLVKVERDIQKYINMAVLAGFAALCFAATKFNFLVQDATIAYNAWTTVSDQQGQTEGKNFVISEFGQAGQSLQSVDLGYQMRSDRNFAGCIGDLLPPGSELYMWEGRRSGRLAGTEASKRDEEHLLPSLDAGHFALPGLEVLAGLIRLFLGGQYV